MNQITLKWHPHHFILNLFTELNKTIIAALPGPRPQLIIP